MTELVSGILGSADYFVLMLLRVGALFIASPIFGRVNIPARVKISLILALSVLFFVAMPLPQPLRYHSMLGFMLMCATEILIGAALAFVTNVFFALAFTAGQLIDMQIGFGIVNVYDAQNNTQIPMTGNLLNLTLLIVFFAVDGHQRLIYLIYLTLEKLPVGLLVFRPEIGMVALEVFVKSFLLGVSVALPVIASGLILEVAFGMLMRTVPQMNMFVVGIPMKILIGFLILFATLPVFANFSDRIFTELFAGVEQMFSTFLAGP